MESVGFEAGAASGEIHGRPTVVGWKKSHSQAPFGMYKTRELAGFPTFEGTFE